MMKHRYYLALSSVLVLGALTSCSVFSKKVKKEAVLPADREQIQVKTPHLTYTPEEIKRGVVKGDWAIETVGSQKAVGQDAPFIKFDPESRKIYGNNGCNVINGEYAYNPADSTLSFSNVASTMRLCNKEGITDTEINIALNSVKFYTWEAQGNDYYLHLLDASGQQVMSLMHQNFEFLNGTWLVTAIQAKPVDVPDMKLVIDVDEGRIHGNTGCNILNGTMEIDMDAANVISFQDIATTRMACPEPNYQTQLIVALEEANTARPVSTQEVVLYNTDHQEVLRLAKTTDTAGL